MQEVEQKKRKKKQNQTTEVVSEEISEAGQDLITVLDELEKEDKYFDVQICPKCKSPRIKRVGAMGGDVGGNMGVVPPKYECSDCGWCTQISIKATNRKLTVRDVELIAEALEVNKK